MSTVLTPGGNTPLTSTRVTVEVAAVKPLDVSALLLAANGKVRSDDDLIFFNQPQGPGVSYSASGITVETSAVPGDVEKIVITASLDDTSAVFAGTEPTATVRDSATGGALATFTPPQLSRETALIVVELYRRGSEWKVRAVGQGYANGLAGIATDFGVSVEEDAPAPAAPPTAPPTPQPTPTLISPPNPVYQSPPAASAPFLPTAQPPVQPPVQPQAPSQPVAPAPVQGGWIPASVVVPEPEPVQETWQLPDSGPTPMPAYGASAPQQQSYQPPVPGYAAIPSPSPAPFQAQPPAAAAPAAPAAGSGRITLDKGKVSLAKGGSVSLVKNGQPFLASVRMGLGWEPAHRGRSVDLDASVIAFDGRRHELEKVWFSHLQAFNGAIQHAGDNLTGRGGGDDEVITVHLQSLPPQVTGLVFTVNSYSGQRFTDVAKAYCRLLDATTGAELVRFNLTQAEPHTGVLMCKLIRMQTGEWVMTGIEEYVDSKTVRGMVTAAANAL